MKKVSYRSSMPFDNRGIDGSPSISPSTNRGIIPFNNVPTIKDIMDGTINLRDYNPRAQGNWASGPDIENNYREKGDDYKRRERDSEILSNLIDNRVKSTQKWRVKVPGGTKTFISFELARQYTREKNIPFSYVQRIAQNVNPQETDRINVISESMGKTFMIQSINVSRNVIDTGSAFCVAPTYFVTCAHVIRKYNKNTTMNLDYFSDSMISLVSGNIKTEAFVVNIDPRLDIAILKSNVVAEPLKIDLDISVGTDIIVVGSPHSYENHVSAGIVGSIGRKVYFYEGAPDYMFVDLSVFPGNSGGPVIKVDNGNVIGMVTLIVSDEGDYGLNAALPSRYIMDFCKANIRGF